MTKWISYDIGLILCFPRFCRIFGNFSALLSLVFLVEILSFNTLLILLFNVNVL